MRILITVLALYVVAFIVGGAQVAVLAQGTTPSQQSCQALQIQDSSVDCTSSSSIGDAAPVKNLLRTIINVFSVVVGAVSVIMIIIGGFRYVISGGDSSSTKAAKDTILYAVIGLAVVIFAQTIVRFVIVKTTAKPAATPSKKMITTRHEVTSLPLLP